LHLSFLQQQQQQQSQQQQQEQHVIHPGIDKIAIPKHTNKGSIVFP
jgi:hypothetical protein